jgi:hypothetical protein
LKRNEIFTFDLSVFKEMKSCHSNIEEIVYLKFILSYNKYNFYLFLSFKRTNSLSIFLPLLYKYCSNFFFFNFLLYYINEKYISYSHAKQKIFR